MPLRLFLHFNKYFLFLLLIKPFFFLLNSPYIFIFYCSHQSSPFSSFYFLQKKNEIHSALWSSWRSRTIVGNLYHKVRVLVTEIPNGTFCKTLYACVSIEKPLFFKKKWIMWKKRKKQCYKTTIVLLLKNIQIYICKNVYAASHLNDLKKNSYLCVINFYNLHLYGVD